MRHLPLHLGPGSDLRGSLEALAQEQQASGFVLAVVGNLSRAAFQCPGQAQPSVLEGDLEIITLNGTLAPEGVHLHLSLSDGACQVWGGHLEPGTLVLKGADLLVGLFAPDPEGTERPGDDAAAGTVQTDSRPGPAAPPRLEIAVLPGCPWSARAVRLLRTLAVPHTLHEPGSDEQVRALIERSGQSTFPQIFLDGALLGGYDALAELHGQGGLATLR